MECCYDFEINGIHGTFEDTNPVYYEEGGQLYFRFDGDAKECLYKKQMSDDVFVKYLLSRTTNVLFYRAENGIVGKKRFAYVGADYEKIRPIVHDNVLYLVSDNHKISIFNDNAFIAVSSTEYESHDAAKISVARGNKKYRVLRKYNLRKMSRYGV